MDEIIKDKVETEAITYQNLKAEQDDIEKQVAAFFADALSISQPVAPTAHFVNDLGGDSLQMLSVMLKIEEA